MNVMRTDNEFAPPRGRAGYGRGRVKLGTLTSNQLILNLVPKYQIPECRRPLVDLAPPSSSSNITTPKNTRRVYTTSSSCRRSSAFGKSTTDSGTAKTTTPGSILDNQEALVIMAITSGRGEARNEVGLAVMDVQYPHMVLSQISDCHSYINTMTKIHTFHPIEILMPATMCDKSNNLYTTIRSRFQGVTISGIPRMHFVDVAGLDRIRTHCAEEFSSVELIVHQKYYALAACAALMKYIEFIQHVQYLPKTMKIEYQVSQNTTMIDIESAQSLELVTSNGGQNNHTLFGALDRCSTPMGRRLLRASILQPPCDMEIIYRRQVCIDEFISNHPLHSIVHTVMRRLSGVNRLLSLAMHSPNVDSVLRAERNLNYLLLLKNVVEIVPELRATLNTANAIFFQNVRNDLNDDRFEMIKMTIFNIIHADARSVMGYTSANMQRCFAIKSGISDMLDVARQTYCELIDDMQLIVANLGEKYRFPLSLGCNMSLGYHIQMDLQRNHNFKVEDMPKEFIQPRKLKNSILMTTEPLVVLSQHCKDACEELHVLSDTILQGTLSEIREYIGCLFKLNDNIAELDLIMSLAQVSSIPEYTKPVFGSKLEIRSSKHPVMDIFTSECPIPNDVVASIPYNFQTITGPNMSGKTIYLKQIVLLHIMAQIGCYIPATKAELRIVDHIFCRLGVRDDIEYNASTFTLEIKEMQYVLQAITPNSLVILDELCKSTTVEEGSSIAWVICEKLAQTSAFTFAATHFLYLLKMTDLYPNITNYYMEAVPMISDDQPDSSRLVYTHQLKQGISPIENYGLILARASNFPADILNTAGEIKNKIMDNLTPAGEDESETSKQAISRREKNYDILVALSEKLENPKDNRKEICELMRKIEVSNDDLFVEVQPKIPVSKSLDENQLATQDIKNLDDTPKSLVVPLPEKKFEKKRPVIISNISAPPCKILKFSSLPQEESTTQFKVPRKPLTNLTPFSQPNIHYRSPNNTMQFSQKTRDILKNPTSHPESPLFVPRSETFVKPFEKNSPRSQVKIVSDKYYPSNLISPVENIENDLKKASSTLDNRHLLLPITENKNSYTSLWGDNRMHIQFDDNIPQDYSYMRHILRNVGNSNLNNSSNQNQSEYFFSSDAVTRQSNMSLLNNNCSEPINNQLHLLNSPVVKNLNTIETPVNYNLIDTPTGVSTVSSPSYVTMPSEELLMIPPNSQTSMNTVLARMLAREKEAKIFRAIEGSDFDEQEFCRSPISIITLDSTSCSQTTQDEL